MPPLAATPAAICEPKGEMQTSGVAAGETALSHPLKEQDMEPKADTLADAEKMLDKSNRDAVKDKAKKERDIKKAIAAAKAEKELKMTERAKAEREVKACEKAIRELLEELAAL